MSLFKKLFAGESREEAAAKKMGKDFVDQLCAKIDAFGQERVDGVVGHLLGVFKQQLEEPYEDRSITPEVLATAKLKVFGEQVLEFSDRMWTELREHILADLAVLQKLEIPEEMMQKLMEKMLKEKVDFLIIGARTLYKMHLQALGIAESPEMIGSPTS